MPKDRRRTNPGAMQMEGVHYPGRTEVLQRRGEFSLGGTPRVDAVQGPGRSFEWRFSGRLTKFSAKRNRRQRSRRRPPIGSKSCRSRFGHGRGCCCRGFSRTQTAPDPCLHIHIHMHPSLFCSLFSVSLGFLVSRLSSIFSFFSFFLFPLNFPCHLSRP